MFLCKSVCGLLLKPISLEENDEISLILRGSGVRKGFWLRITDEEESKYTRQSREAIWKDFLNEKTINFTNWADEEPSDYNYARTIRHDYARMIPSNGKWYSTGSSGKHISYIVCEHC